MKLNFLPLFIITTFCYLKVSSQCNKSVEIQKLLYCIVADDDENLFKRQNTHTTEYSFPRKEQFSPGHYLVWNRERQELYMYFYVNTERHFEGFIFEFHRKRREANVVLDFEMCFADGEFLITYPRLNQFPMNLFVFSEKGYKKINKIISKALN